MENMKDNVLDNYTQEELARILDEECKKLDIPCVKNGQATKFEPLISPMKNKIY